MPVTRNLMKNTGVCNTPILVTLGEPAGIGPDCVLLAWQAEPETFAGVCVCAPAAWLQNRAVALGISVPIREISSPEPSSRALNCWNPGVEDTVAIKAGRPQTATAPAVVRCIEAAARACMQGYASAMTTGPIEKSLLRNAGFTFPGHTEFLAHMAGVEKVVMMLASSKLRVALLTTHMPLRDVPASLNVKDTVNSIRITHRDLQRRFGIQHPRLALCGLNPHAGESGHFGREELDVLGPAAEKAGREGIHITGPLPADTLFTAGRRDAFDAIICCYHDQGLIPLKALSFGDAVNITLGLPFIRTSVDHGTALDRAGGGKVLYSSLVSALQLARTMHQEGAGCSQVN